MYVFGKIHGSKIVNVHESPTEYWVRVENGSVGKYFWKVYPKYNPDYQHFKTDINNALQELNWIAEGNEFPN